MKVIEAIEEANILKPNMYDTEVKIKWLDRLDRRIFQEVWMTHVLTDEEMAPYLPDDTPAADEDIVIPPQPDGTQGGTIPSVQRAASWALELPDDPAWRRQAALVFPGYTQDDTETGLLVQSPYDELYVHWLEAQIDWNNRELDGFNASNAIFEAVYANYRNAFNRSHMPLGAAKRYF